MELHQLRYFLAVAETRNFTRAAERCHVAQPSLSQQIMKLEDELGERLLERSRRHVALTAAGALFVQHATRVLAEVDEARERIRDLGEVVQGSVAVGVLPTVAPYTMPQWLQALRSRHPAVELTAHEDTTGNLLRMLRARELDVAVISVPVAGRDLVVTPLLDEALLVALPEAHALVPRKSIRMSDLVDEPFVLMREEHCLAGQSLQFCQMKGIAPHIAFRSAQMETVLSFVAAGFGVSLVPEMASQSRTIPGVRFRTIEAPGPRRALGLVSLRNRVASRAQQAVISCIGEVLGGDAPG